MLLNQLAAGSRWTLEQIIAALEASEKKEAKESKADNMPQREHVESGPADPLVVRAIHYLCNAPELAHQVEPFALIGKSSDDLLLFQELLEVCRHFEKPTFPVILESVDRSYLSRLVEIAEQDLHVQVCPEGFLEVCHKLQQRDLDHQLKVLIEKSRQGDLSAKEKLFLREALNKKKPVKSSK
jgi:hypothetical protein